MNVICGLKERSLRHFVCDKNEILASDSQKISSAFPASVIKIISKGAERGPADRFIGSSRCYEVL